MKRKLQRFHLSLLASLLTLSLFAQTGQQILKPIILGDSILCPNSGSVLHTQKIYDSYHWYERDYFSDDKVIIKGATTNELTINSDDVLKYFTVEVNLKGVKRTSDEKLIDGLVFIPPSVRSIGDFKNGPNFYVLSEGDTGLFTLLKPYNTNISWYKDGKPIPGATLNKLYVTEAGTYTVKGAPAECPDYIQYLGVDLIVKKRIQKPKITGDTMLCPDSKGVLQTQTGYDSYQWYKRWMGTNTKKPVPGATSNTLSIGPSKDAGAYFSVEVTKNGDLLKSKEQFVDAYAFLPLSVISGGNFINGPGYFILNNGDTGTFTITQPYDTSITWYKFSNPIEGENHVILNVTTGGKYFVQAAPSVCPAYLQNPGLILEVRMNNQNSSAQSTDAIQVQTINASMKLFPNPAKGYVVLDVGSFTGKDININISGSDGKIVYTNQYQKTASTIKLNISNLTPGVYFLKAGDTNHQQVMKLAVTK